MKLKKFRGYIFSRSFLGERVPQHIQNIVIREYCEKNNLHYLLSSTEYVIEDSHLMLEQTLNELDNIKGIVAYSLFQLPQEKSKRLKYLCCETIKNSKIKLKKVNNNSSDGLLNYELNRLNVNCDKYDFPIVQKIRKKRTKK